MPPSLVVVAWATLGSTTIARDFLSDGPRGVRGSQPGLPVTVVGGENDGEVPSRMEGKSVRTCSLWSRPFRDNTTPRITRPP